MKNEKDIMEEIFWDSITEKVTKEIDKEILKDLEVIEWDDYE